MSSLRPLRLLPLLALLTVAFAAEPAKPAALLCPVSDEPITDPINAPSFVSQKAGQPDRVVQFCCEGCIADFKAKPAKYLAKLDARASAVTAKNCGCACCKGKAVCCCAADDETPAVTAVAAQPAQPTKPAAPAAEKSPAAESNPLRGVIVAVDAEKSTMRVKHEKIPGYMGAMTMQFRVAPGTVPKFALGQTISATLYRENKDFWLRDVAVQAVPAK